MEGGKGREEARASDIHFYADSFVFVTALCAFLPVLFPNYFISTNVYGNAMRVIGHADKFRKTARVRMASR